MTLPLPVAPFVVTLVTSSVVASGIGVWDMKIFPVLYVATISDFPSMLKSATSDVISAAPTPALKLYLSGKVPAPLPSKTVMPAFTPEDK